MLTPAGLQVIELQGKIASIEANRTWDSLFDGNLQCCQYEKGYRFSLDAVLLSHFVKPLPGQQVLDMGAGCGIISLILCYRFPDIRVTALELQPQLISLIRHNITQNNFDTRIQILRGNLRRIKKLTAAERYDQVVCNPPYGSRGSGRQNINDEMAVARHEIVCNLEDIVQAISYSLRNRGRASIIYPADRAARLINTLQENKLEPKKVQTVYSYPGCNGKLILVESVKNGGEELTILPPFYVYTKRNGGYSPEMAKLYEKNM